MRHLRNVIAYSSLILVMAPLDAVPQTLPPGAGVQHAHPALLRQLVLPDGSVPRNQRLFQLWLAQALVDAGAFDPSGGPEVEQLHALGALDRLRVMAESADAETRDAANALAASIRTALDLDGAAGARPLRLEDGRSAMDSSPTGEWFAMRIEPDREYRFSSSSCQLLRALVVDAEGRGLAGQAVYTGTFTFHLDQARDARIRLTTPACTAPLDVSEGAVAVALPRAPSRDDPAMIELSRRYRGELPSTGNHWLRLDDVAAGQRYIVDVIPDGSSLDPSVTAFAANGNVELGSDDDSGEGWASRLSVTVPDGVSGLLLRIGGLGSGGSYVVSAAALRPVSELATTAEIGVRNEGTVVAGQESWWRVATIPGRSYVIEVAPANGVDSVLSVFDADGSTLVGEDDDGGTSPLGSRLEFTARGEVVFAKVTALGGASGLYALSVEVGRAPRDVARPLRLNSTVRGALRDNWHEWWRVDLRAGQRYAFEAIPDGDRLDTVLEIYADEGARLLGSNDDDGVGLGSRLEWTADANATIYVKVSRYDHDTGEYRLSVRPIARN